MSAARERFIADEPQSRRGSIGAFRAAAILSRVTRLAVDVALSFETATEFTHIERRTLDALNTIAEHFEKAALSSLRGMRKRGDRNGMPAKAIDSGIAAASFDAVICAQFLSCIGEFAAASVEPFTGRLPHLESALTSATAAVYHGMFAGPWAALAWSSIGDIADDELEPALDECENDDDPAEESEPDELDDDEMIPHLYFERAE